MKIRKKIDIDCDIFKEETVKQAIEDYARIAHITLNRTENKATCTITSFGFDTDTVALEFENYLIELSQRG